MMKIILVCLSFLGLTGCANQAFDCPYQEGLRCLRLSEIDRRIDEGSLPKTDSSPKSSRDPHLQIKDAPLNHTEDTLTLWVAPYQSKEGIMHEQQWIHFAADQDDPHSKALDLD